ncbi:MAG: membrane assembly protein AsmA [Bacteroidetes bacterium]|nr:membrane assembly protein AsmA [Bacteroidota bacterium]
MKKALKWIGIFLLVVIVFLVAAPFLFKDKIVSKIKEETNKNLNAKVDFGDFDLSLFRSFPDFSLRLNELKVINVEPFAGDTLIYTKQLDLTVDLMSVIKGGEIKIKSVDLNSAIMNFLVDKDGKANWDIAKPSTGPETASEPSSFKANLKHYAISNSRIIYDDKSLGFYLKLDGVNHSGKGDFTQDLFVLSTNTEASNVDMAYGGLNYISKAKATIAADLDMDMKNFKFTFKDNKIHLNELDLGVNGWVAMPDTNIDMDLKFAAAQSEFRNFISMIPAVYSPQFKDLKSSGKMSLSGFIKGRYNALSMPGFGLTLNIDNGMFQYPSLPAAVKNVFVDLNVTNPDGVPDHTFINLSKLHVEMAGDPFDAKLILKTPVSDPDLDAFFKGKIILDNIGKLVPLEQGTALTGIITADLSAKGKLSAVEQKKFDQFYASGNLGISGMKYSSASMKQALIINTLQLAFNPQIVSMSALNAKLGKSDFAATGSLENFLPYALKGETIKGNLKLTSTTIDLNEMMGSESSTASTTADTSKMSVVEIPGNIDFSLNANIGTLAYQNFTMKNISGGIVIRDKAIRMNDVMMQMMDGSLKLNGGYSSADLKKPAIDFGLAVKDWDIQKTVTTFNTVEKMAPIAKNTSGKFSVDMTVAGLLDQQMSPVVNSLNGGGKLNTSKIVVQNFPAFNKIADVLKMPSWKKLDIPGMNPSFKFMNGRVYVDPFDVSLNGFKSKIGGSNGFDQTIDYTVYSDIPRASFGGAANAALDNLLSAANSKGVNLSVGDMIPVNIKIGGTVTDPKISTDLNKQGAKAMDDLKAAAKAEFDKKKAEAEAKVREEADKVKAQAQAKLDAEKAKATAEADRIKKEAEAKAKAKADSIKKAAEQKAKDELKNLNPFKK